MKVVIKKDWEHSLAPNSLFKRGSEVELTAADVHSGIASGYVCDPNDPEDVVKPQVAPVAAKKPEKAVSKKVKQKR